MKKLLAIVVLGLLWCNVGLAKTITWNDMREMYNNQTLPYGISSAGEIVLSSNNKEFQNSEIAKKFLKYVNDYLKTRIACYDWNLSINDVDKLSTKPKAVREIVNCLVSKDLMLIKKYDLVYMQNLNEWRNETIINLLNEYPKAVNHYSYTKKKKIRKQSQAFFQKELDIQIGIFRWMEDQTEKQFNTKDIIYAKKPKTEGKKPEKKTTETINEILNKPCGKEDQSTPCSAVVINVASKKLFEWKYSYSIRQAYDRAMSDCKKATGNDDLCVFWILGGKRVGHLDTRTASIDPKTVNDSGLIVVKKPKVKNVQSKDIDSSLITIGSGSGFYINNKGYALTNNHVVDICKQMVTVVDGKEILLRVLNTDKINDVAVLKTNYKSKSYIKINEDGAKLGENVIAVGYPLAGRLSDSVKITRGIVSSLSGLANNIGQIQIDAALQPGNSGGPVLNENGELVGIASAGLNKLLMAKEAKYIPENVNFAVASPIVVNILKSKKIKYTTPSIFGGSFSNTELAELGDSSTIQLFCRNTRTAYNKLKRSKKYSTVLLDLD